MATIVTLICLVNGDSSERTFAVDISNDKLVVHLKDEIKKKKSPKFDDIPADELTLWRVDIPDDDEAAILQADTATETLMRPTREISVYFKNQPTMRRIHVVIERPPGK
jgi:Crinkler effector protein N-terminal domain